MEHLSLTRNVRPCQRRYLEIASPTFNLARVYEIMQLLSSSEPEVMFCFSEGGSCP